MSYSSPVPWVDIALLVGAIVVALNVTAVLLVSCVAVDDHGDVSVKRARHRRGIRSGVGAGWQTRGSL